MMEDISKEEKEAADSGRKKVRRVGGGTQRGIDTEL